MASSQAVWGLDLGRSALKAVKLRPGPDGSVELIAQDLIEHAQVLTQPDAGPTPIAHIPGTPPLADGDPRGQAPLTGAHSREILARLGLDDAEIERLAAEGVTKLADSP